MSKRLHMQRKNRVAAQISDTTHFLATEAAERVLSSNESSKEILTHILLLKNFTAVQYKANLLENMICCKFHVVETRYTTIVMMGENSKCEKKKDI